MRSAQPAPPRLRNGEILTGRNRSPPLLSRGISPLLTSPADSTTALGPIPSHVKQESTHRPHPTRPMACSATHTSDGARPQDRLWRDAFVHQTPIPRRPSPRRDRVKEGGMTRTTAIAIFKQIEWPPKCACGHAHCTTTTDFQLSHIELEAVLIVQKFKFDAAPRPPAQKQTPPSPHRPETKSYQHDHTNLIPPISA